MVRHHWRPEIFAYGGWGTSYHRASSAQRDLLDRFRNPNSTRRVEAGEYDGPFPLAGGVLIVLGRGLNREIVSASVPNLPVAVTDAAPCKGNAIWPLLRALW
eukprot:scaffold272266_cov30-Tisochrysis_lutea.AAC.5